MKEKNSENQNEKVRKMFYEDLPKWRFGKKKSNGEIDWKESVEYWVKFTYDNIEGKVKILGYEPKGQYLYIQYLDEEPFRINTRQFKDCGIGKLLGKITNEFKIEIGTVFKDENRNIVIIDRKIIKEERIDKLNRKSVANLKFYKYRCNKCGFECGEHYKNGEYKEELWIREDHLLNNIGCSACCHNPQIVAQGINDIFTTDEWMVKFFQNSDDAKKYTYNSTKKLFPICPYCGRIKNKKMSIDTIHNSKSIGCSCGDGFSFGHKYVFNMLEQLNISFEDNKTYDWCRFYNIYKRKEIIGEYDFIIENMKLIIEVDGGWHRRDNNMSGQTKEESIFIDDEKDRLAKENGYDIIRISDEDNIKDNILASNLINLFDLNKIDWVGCEEYALSNLVKEACELKQDNPDLTTKNIGEIMNLERTTIINYLKKGSKIWDWINYDPKEEMIKGSSKRGKLKGKKVETFKDGVSLGVFDSCSELVRQSEELFGVKFSDSCISEVCRGKCKSHKGYYFKFV